MQACYCWHISTTQNLTLLGREASFHLSLLPSCSPTPGITRLSVLLAPQRNALQSALAPALSALSGLEALRLVGLSSEDVSRGSLSCILCACSSLTLLTSLDLTFDGLTPLPRHPHDAPHPLSELDAAVTCLPHLQSFHLRYSLTATCLQALDAAAPPADPNTAAAEEPPRKRAKRSKRSKRAHAAACNLCHKTHPPPPSITSLDPLVATLSAASALTALQLPPCTSLPCMGLRGAFHALESLDLGGVEYLTEAAQLRTKQAAAADGPFFSQLAGLLPLAPLPNLRTFSMLDDTIRTPETVSRLIEQLAAQPGLATLSLNTAAVAGGTVRVLDAVETLVQARRRSLTALYLRVGVQWLHQLTSTVNRTVAAAARLPALRRLRLHFVEANARVQMPFGSPMPGSPAAPFCLAKLSRLKNLDTLELTYGRSLPKYWRRKFIAAFLQVPMASMSALTSLSFSCQAGMDFDGVIVLTARPLHTLSRLHRLRSLTLKDVTTQPEVQTDMRGLLSPLTALTEIVLHLSPLTDALLRSFAAAAATLKELRRTEFVQPGGVEESSAFLVALPSLPRRGQYLFTGMQRTEPLAVQQMVARQLRAAGADVCPEFSYLMYPLPGVGRQACLSAGTESGCCAYYTDDMVSGGDEEEDASDDVSDDGDDSSAEEQSSSSSSDEAGESDADVSDDEEMEDEEEEDDDILEGVDSNEGAEVEEKEPGIFSNMALGLHDGVDEHFGGYM